MLIGPIRFFSYLTSPSTDSAFSHFSLRTQQGSPLKVTGLRNAFESLLTDWSRTRGKIVGSAWDLGNWSLPGSVRSRMHVSGAQKRDLKERSGSIVGGGGGSGRKKRGGGGRSPNLESLRHKGQADG